MARPASISLIVPCLNEEKNLQGAIDSIKKALNESGSFPDYEVLIFDDRSTDSTGAVAEEIKRREKNIRVIHNKRN
ncbi:MAG: glycosyltransferase, partial [Deltaproteobacteria bacterium]|nr:glycosyltransferase [Deltaproteobacteria bacterium]